jgi:endonuclease YncB( thermonuclease family)
MRRLALLPLLLLFVLPATPAGAHYIARCRGGHTGPKCHFWYAKVKEVNDGDTITVDIEGDHTSKWFKVRFSSIQAMEQTVYSNHPSRRRGECHALDATSRIEGLIKKSHRLVKISSQNRHAMQDIRLRRSIAVKVDGHWRNLGTYEIREGLTLWLPGVHEDAWNSTYDLLAQQARQKGTKIWNPTYCGVGPQQDVPLRAWINWDPVGIDAHELAHEWVKIQNQSTTTTLSLNGWWIRTADYPRYHFPAGTKIAPGQTLTFYTGRGTDTATSVHWGLKHTIFENPGDKNQLGGGAYLFDPQGDLRLAEVYPCLVACADPLDGAISLSVQPRSQREWVDIRNNSTNDVDLYGYQLIKPGYQYIFDGDSVLHAGEKLRLYGGGNPSNDSRLVRYWGIHHPMYADGGGNILLRNFRDKTLACDSWASGHC